MEIVCESDSFSQNICYHSRKFYHCGGGGGKGHNQNENCQSLFLTLLVIISSLQVSLCAVQWV